MSTIPPLSTVKKKTVDNKTTDMNAIQAKNMKINKAVNTIINATTIMITNDAINVMPDNTINNTSSNKVTKKPLTPAKQKKLDDWTDRYEDSLTIYRTIKCPLKSIVKKDSSIAIIQLAVNNTTKIVIHTYNFLKLYVLYTYETTKKCPLITKELIGCIMRTVSSADSRGRDPSDNRQPIRDMLTIFYDTHYSPLIPDDEIKPCCTNLSTVLDYESESMITCFENHIKEHYPDFINRYINVVANKATSEENIKNNIKTMKEAEINDIHNDHRKKFEQKKVKLLIKNIRLIDSYKRDIDKLNDLKTTEKTNNLSLYISSINRKEKEDINKLQTEHNIESKKHISSLNLYKKYNDIQKDIIKQFRTSLQNVKKDILERTDKCDPNYNKIKQDIRTKMLPNLNLIKINIDATDDNTNTNYSLTRYINSDPLAFMKSMIDMSQDIENRKQKTFGCFPLRNSIMPKYMKLDTTTVVNLLLPPNYKGITKNEYKVTGNIIKYRDVIWGHSFWTDKKIFNMYSNKRHANRDSKNTYVFDNQICTDGIGCSILLMRKDKYRPDKHNKITYVKKPNSFSKDVYLEDMPIEERQFYKDYNIVGIDPGKEDLIYCTSVRYDKNGRLYILKFRYSQDQRRHETKSKRYQKIIENHKKETKIAIDGVLKTVKEIETELSECNFKSCIYENVKSDIKKKNKINNILRSYYSEELYRKLKFNGYRNRQKSESKMINNFKRIFGGPKEVLVYMGDWSQRHQMRYKEPTKGKAFRNLFRREGYAVPLIDEYNSTAKSFITGGDNEKFRKRGSPRPKKRAVKKNIKEYVQDRKVYPYRLQHGLLRTECVPKIKQAKEDLQKMGLMYNYMTGKLKKITNPNKKVSDHILVNRDLNGSLGIGMKAECHIKGLDIPLHLRR